MRSQSAVVITIVFLLLPFNCRAQEPTRVPPTPLSSDLLWHRAPALFPVVVRLPEAFDSTQAYPAVVALHGFGSSSPAFAGISAAFTEAGFIVILPEAPYIVPSEEVGIHLSWDLNMSSDLPLTDDPTLSLQSSQLLVFDHLPAALQIVKERYILGPVFAFGFSQGAVYALLDGFYNRANYAAVVSFGLPDFQRDWYAVTGETLEDGRQVPILLVHGRDDAVAPISVSEAAHAQLREAGYRVTLESFNGGHTVPRDQVHRVIEWLRTLDSRR